METDLCSDSFLTSSAFSHLPSCPYLCFSYDSTYAVTSHSCLTQSGNVWIPPRLTKVLLWNVTRFVLFFYFCHPWEPQIKHPTHLSWWFNHYLSSAEEDNPFFPHWCEWTRDPIWTAQVSGLKAPRSSLLRPCSLLLWGHQKIRSVHSSFS